MLVFREESKGIEVTREGPGASAQVRIKAFQRRIGTVSNFYLFALPSVLFMATSKGRRPCFFSATTNHDDIDFEVFSLQKVAAINRLINKQ